MGRPVALISGGIVALMLLLTAASASEASRPPPAAAPCAGCHGAHGEGGANGRYPRLAGQPAAYLEKQLHDFQSGRRTSAVMQPQARGLSERQIDALADYYSRQQPPWPARGKVNPALLRLGRELVERGDWPAGTPACASCHGPDVGGLAPDFPALAGQYKRYIEAELHAWQDGRRRNDPMGLMQRVVRGLDEADVNAVAAYLAWLRPDAANAVPVAANPPKASKAGGADAGFIAGETPFRPPPESAIPAGPDGDMIRLGAQVFTQTGRYAQAYIGNALTCANCHLDRGRKPDSAPMWAAYVRYPRYRKKNDKVNTMTDRIQGCFTFSMNGKPPPPDSKPMVALVSYLHWLATGAPVGVDLKGQGYPELPKPAAQPDPVRGETVFEDNCALCHAADGQGRQSGGVYVFPPLWGARSFNWGAGMHRVNTAAAFIKANMPYGVAPTLTDQQAWDVAAFVVSHPRPQDPRFTGEVDQTRAKYHKHTCYYGKTAP